MTMINTSIRSVKWEEDKIILLDQRLLPAKTDFLTLTTIEDVWEAIFELKVRGAPAIGIAAAYGLALWAIQSNETDIKSFKEQLKEKAAYLESSRPTAVNLSWALKRLVAKVITVSTVAHSKETILSEAISIDQEDEKVCRQIGEYALTLFKDGDTLLTHCNAGGIATSRYGTALAPFYLAKERGITLRAFASETRPVLQGARLTAWELNELGVDVTLITDNMVAHTMKSKVVNAVIVGADRIAANGDTANKIGTYGIALLAKAHNIPFYVAAPLSTIDLETASGDSIEIEERNPDEVRTLNGEYITPRDINVFNPAFDVTPAELIAGIVTEKGIITGDYKAKLRELN